MERKMLTRYLILITALMIFAGAAWYFTKDSGAPRSGAVLANLETRLSDSRDCAFFGQEDMSADAETEPTYLKVRAHFGQEDKMSPLWEEASHEL